MSIFGMMGMGSDDQDPIFGPLRQMDNMFNSMLQDPFSMMNNMMMGPMGAGMMGMGGQRRPVAGPIRRQHELMPFGSPFGGMMGFPNMNSLMSNMANNGNCHSFSSSTVMTMSSGPHGQPQIYQASSTTRSAPGGIRETKKTVCDSRTGTKKMAIGHHIGERGHVVEREQNVYTGEREQREDLINLDEDDAPEFNREWEAKTGSVGVGAVTYGRPDQRRSEQLALPSTTTSVPTSTTSALRAKARAAARARRNMLGVPSSSRVEITEVTDEDEGDNVANSGNHVYSGRSASPIIEYPASNPRRDGRDRQFGQSRTHIREHNEREGSRKRDHEEDYEDKRRHNKSRKPY